MDWFTWLSRTNLEPSLIYEYGLAFARNELQLKDATHFNHEFLQSMGISVAKHRLEILKLANKENHPTTTTAGKLSTVIKKCLKKCLSISKLAATFRSEDQQQHVVNQTRDTWRRALVTKHVTEERRSRAIALSGPLDGRMMHEKMVNSKVLKLSGPLDGKVNERIMYGNSYNRSPMLNGRFVGTAKSPRLSGPLDVRAMVNNRSPRLTRPFDESPLGYSPCSKTRGHSDYDEDCALWSALFDDLKPT